MLAASCVSRCRKAKGARLPKQQKARLAGNWRAERFFRLDVRCDRCALGTSSMGSSAVNIWQILFFVAVAVYALHMYILSHEESATLGSSKPSSSLRDSNLQRKPKPMAIPSVKANNIEGEFAGKPFVILDTTVSPAAEQVALERLQELKQTSSRPTVLQDFGPKRLQQLRFIHIPRNGISFAKTVAHYCCQHLDDMVVDAKAKYDMQPWKLDPSCRACLRQPLTANGEYWSYFPYFPDHDRGRAIAIFRSPIDRISSQVVEMRSLRGMMVAMGISNSDAELFTAVVTNKFKDTFATFSSTLKRKSSLLNSPMDSLTKGFVEQFWEVSKSCYQRIQANTTRGADLLDSCRWRMAARYPGIRGCQARMVLGKRCIDSYVPSAAEMDLIQKRMQEDFAFIGKMERKEIRASSDCLFFVSDPFVDAACLCRLVFFVE